MNSEVPQPTVVPSSGTLTALETGRRMVDAASDKKAQDIVLLDVRHISSLADYFVICSAAVERQVRAIADGVEEALDAVDVPPYKREGNPSDGWVLLDYGDVLMHIMSEEQRGFYRLEQLWEQAHIILRVQ
jgi:ribosome-associated protein